MAYRVFIKLKTQKKYYDLYGSSGEFYEHNKDFKIKEYKEYFKNKTDYIYKIIELSKIQSDKLNAKNHSDIFGNITDKEFYKELMEGKV